MSFGLKFGVKSAAVRKAFFARHRQLVQRLPRAKQALFHERTLHGLQRALPSSRSFNKNQNLGLGLILAQRRMRKLARSS